MRPVDAKGFMVENVVPHDPKPSSKTAVELPSCDAPASTAKLGSLALRTKAGWPGFMAAERAMARKYCLWQCGENQCCDAGARTFDAGFIVIADSTKQGRFPGGAVDDGGSEVTLVTQGTADRVKMFDAQAARWPGPKVVLFGVYNHTPTSARRAAAELAMIRVASRRWVNTRVIALLITYRPGAEPDKYSPLMSDPKLGLYPINTLRNVAIDQARTNWVFPLDIDFLPTSSLYHRFVKYHLPRLASVSKPAAVVPHFEALAAPAAGPSATSSIQSGGPADDFATLRDHILRGITVPFHTETSLLIPELDGVTEYSRAWPQGVAATNYSRWYYSSALGQRGFFRVYPTWNPYEYTVRYWEPYLFVQRYQAGDRTGRPHTVLPRYTEAYIGRFRNKVEFVASLRAARYNFYVLQQEFASHVPHNTTSTKSSDIKVLKKMMVHLDEVKWSMMLKKYGHIEGGRETENPYPKGWLCVGGT